MGAPNGRTQWAISSGNQSDWLKQIKVKIFDIWRYISSVLAIEVLNFSAGSLKINK